MRKLLPWLVSLLLAITLIVVVAFIFWNNLFGDKNKDPDQAVKEATESVQLEPISADEMVKVTSELIDISTNLADTDYIVRISLSFQFDSEKAKE